MPDLRQALKDFVATANSGKYPDEATLISKFPELQGYDVNALKDFVATANSGKYTNEDELFSKFPEFGISGQQPVSKKKVGTALPSAVGSSVSSKPLKGDDDIDYFQGAFGDVLRGFDKYSPIGLGDFVDDMARSVAAGYRQGTAAEEADRLLLQGTKATPEQIQKFINANKNAQSLGSSAEMQNYQKIYENEGKGFWGAVREKQLSEGLLPDAEQVPKCAGAQSGPPAGPHDQDQQKLQLLEVPRGPRAEQGVRGEHLRVPGAGRLHRAGGQRPEQAPKGHIRIQHRGEAEQEPRGVPELPPDPGGGKGLGVPDHCKARGEGGRGGRWREGQEPKGERHPGGCRHHRGAVCRDVREEEAREDHDGRELQVREALLAKVFGDARAGRGHPQGLPVQQEPVLQLPKPGGPEKPPPGGQPKIH